MRYECNCYDSLNSRCRYRREMNIIHVLIHYTSISQLGQIHTHYGSTCEVQVPPAGRYVLLADSRH